MALTTVSENTQAATPGTEHTLQAITTAGVFVLTVDVLNLGVDEVLELRAKVKALTGGTIRTYGPWPIIGPGNSEDAEYISVPVVGYYGVTFTLKQLNGSSRNFPWRIDQL